MEVAALIGDVVASRSRASGHLFSDLAGVLDAVNGAVPASTPLQLTVGDEFQAVYATVSGAVAATWELAVRLRAAGEGIEARAGIGWGAIVAPEGVEGVTPFAGQAGSGWWNARTALDRVEDRARRGRPSSLRTAVEGSEDDPLWNAFLLCRDELLGRLDARDAEIALATLAGSPQAHIAAALEISQPAVSKRLQSLYGLVMAHAELTT